jgi:hypothetical protein
MTLQEYRKQKGIQYKKLSAYKTSVITEGVKSKEDHQ